MISRTDFEKYLIKTAGTPAWKTWRFDLFRQFETDGLPKKSNELWKYSSLKPLQEIPFTPLLAEEAFQFKATKSAGFTNLTFINGILDVTLSDLNELTGEIDFKPFSQLVSNDNSQHLRGLINNHSQFKNAFSSLSSAMMSGGGVLTVKDGYKATKPVRLLFLSGSARVNPAVFPWVLVQMGKNSELSLFCDNGGNKTYFNCPRLDVFLDRNSICEFVRTAEESNEAFHFSSLNFSLKQAAVLNFVDLCSLGRFSRVEANFALSEKDAQLTVSGGYLINENQQVDHYTFIDHASGYCTSRQLYKGILTDKARAVFNGRVRIGENCDGANSEQLNKNLLLSSQAEVDTKPQLEISSDDVKATHGATVGQFNTEELFYFRSRGISKQQAFEMLSSGFLGEISDGIKNKLVREIAQANLAAALKRVLK